jgi:6-phosphogluconolactonase
MRGEEDPRRAAWEYEAELREHFGVEPPELPRFDLIVLGVGADGHTASLFPGTAALDERERWVVANEVPQLNTTRITLTYPVLNNAAMLLFLVAGADKVEAIQRIFAPTNATPPPAASAHAVDGVTLWMFDAKAAAGLPRALSGGVSAD